MEIDKDEIERERSRWNRLLVQDTAYKFNKVPNTLLVETVKDKKPGAALDLGMGQGRNSIYLAQQGWEVTGVDIADQAVAFARDRARKENVKINIELTPMEKFNYGLNKWDLIVHVYEGCIEEKGLADKVLKSLKPEGLFVFEFFHREAGIEMKRPDFGCERNSIMKKIDLAGGFKILLYNEGEGIADYGLRKYKLVKLVAVKK